MQAVVGVGGREDQSCFDAGVASKSSCLALDPASNSSKSAVVVVEAVVVGDDAGPAHYRALAKYSTAGWHPNLFAKPATQPRGSAESSRSLSASAVCDPDINTQHSKKVVRRKGESRG